MRVEHLYYLCELAKYSSMNKAAEELFISQSHDLYIGLWQIFKALWKNRKNYTLYVNK